MAAFVLVSGRLVTGWPSFGCGGRWCLAHVCFGFNLRWGGCTWVTVECVLESVACVASGSVAESDGCVGCQWRGQ
eukprot:395789-Prorocentrum_lima.AAC.1